MVLIKKINCSQINADLTCRENVRMNERPLSVFDRIFGQIKILIVIGILVAPAISWGFHESVGPEVDITSLGETNRKRSHSDAATFLSRKHFYRNGRGMIAAGAASQRIGSAQGFTAPVEFLIRKRWGLLATPSGSGLIGLFPLQEQGVRLTAAGCVLCHSGRAAGITVVGLGNKTIDISRIAKDLLREGQASQLFRATFGEQDPRQTFSIAFLEGFSAGNFENLTQGLVPSARIRSWFYRSAGRSIPSDEARAQVKIPHWWGFAEKMQAGIDWDGYGAGVGWALGVELVAGQSLDTAKSLVPEGEELVRKLGHLLPPLYPFPIDPSKASQGKLLFERTCARCHGQYERDSLGLPIFRTPKLVPQKVVGTDPDRLKGNSAVFADLVDRNPFSKWMRRGPGGLAKEAGYFAPRLEGIWARFPYLHNASVPTLVDLFIAPEHRPRYWSLSDAGEAHRFSQERVGLTLPANEKEDAGLKLRARRGDRDVYSVNRVGHSNQGHWFPEMRALRSSEVRAIVEYLKTL